MQSYVRVQGDVRYDAPTGSPQKPFCGRAPSRRYPRYRAAALYHEAGEPVGSTLRGPTWGCVACVSRSCAATQDTSQEGSFSWCRQCRLLPSAAGRSANRKPKPKTEEASEFSNGSGDQPLVAGRHGRGRGRPGEMQRDGEQPRP